MRTAQRSALREPSGGKLGLGHQRWTALAKLKKHKDVYGKQWHKLRARVTAAGK